MAKSTADGWSPMTHERMLRHHGLCRLRCWLKGEYAWQVTNDDNHWYVTCLECGKRRKFL